MCLIFRNLLIVMILFFSLNVYAYNLERAQVNLATDYASCASYYLIAHQGLKKAKDTALSRKYYTLYEVSLKGSILFSNVKVTEARLKLSYEGQTKEMGENFSNMAILNQKYGKLCANLLKSPKKRLDYWLKK